jgi:hypothetical protein
MGTFAQVTRQVPSRQKSEIRISKMDMCPLPIQKSVENRDMIQMPMAARRAITQFSKRLQLVSSRAFAAPTRRLDVTDSDGRSRPQVTVKSRPETRKIAFFMVRESSTSKLTIPDSSELRGGFPSCECPVNQRPDV